MSALRKLRQLKLNAAAGADESEAKKTEADSTSTNAAATIVEPPEKPKMNAFEMLAAAEEEEEEEEVEEVPSPIVDDVKPAADAQQSNVDANQENEIEQEESAAPKREKPAKAKKTNATKAKKGAAKATAVPTQPEQEDWELEFAPTSAASAASSSPSASPSAASSSSSSQNVWSLLHTESKLLDASTEIRAVFGSRMDRGSGPVDDVAAAPPGHNHGGFRKGGALARRMAGGGVGARAAAVSKRLLIRPNPQWPRTEDRGLLKMQFVQAEAEPKPPRKTIAATGMHGNIHSLNTPPPAASSSSSSAEEKAEAAEYAAALHRYHTQQTFAMTPGVMEYTFVHSQEFERLQQEYLSVAASQDVQQLSWFARAHPFHPEANLTMAEIFAAQSEYATAHEFVQRVLHVFENAFTPTFISAVQEGRARMDGDRSENQPFFTALARHAQTLGKKGCPRTALEVVKLLLSLSPLQDPMGMLFAIDYYALRAKQYAFLREFPRNLDQAVISAYSVGAHPWSGRPAASPATAAAAAAPGFNIATLNAPAASSSSSSSGSGWALPVPRAPATFLPNLMYSRALAAFHMEHEAAVAAAGGGKDKKKATSSSSSSSVPTPQVNSEIVQPPSLPNSSLGGHSLLDEQDLPSSATASSASYLLQQALLMWPSVLKPLLEAAGQESAVGRAPWSNLIAQLNALYEGSFLTSASAHPASTPYLAKLELIYTERSASLWKSDRVIAWLLANAQALVKALEEKKYSSDQLQKFKDTRMRYLLSLPFPAVVKSLQKSAYSDHVPHLPPELLMAQQAFDAGAERARFQREQMAAAGMQPLNLDQHPMRVFLQSLLPWFVVDGQGQLAPAEDGDEGIEQAVAQLQALPPEQREQALRGLANQMAEIEDEDDAALEAALQAEARQPQENDQDDNGGAAGGINYGDYQFDDEEESQQ